MRLDFRRWVASCLLIPTVALGAAQRANAASIFDCFTGKKTSTASNCKTGQCGSAPAAAAPGGTVPGGTQPYMVPIGPPRYIPAPAGSQPGAPSLSPSGVSIPSSDPATVSRPVWPANGLPQSTYYQPATTVPSTVPSPYPSTVPSNVPSGVPSAVSPVPSSVYPGSSCPTCQQTVGVNYAPYTAYRSQTINVPTTLYRPVTAIDPRTGTAVTVLQPCQTTTQQVQRTPAPFSRSFARAYRPIPVSKKPTTVGMPVTTVPLVVNPAYVPVVSTPSTAPGATWNTYGAVAPTGGYYMAPAVANPYAAAPNYGSAYATVPATGYAPPSYSAPSYASPSYSAPAYVPPAPQASTVPGATAAPGPWTPSPGTGSPPPPPRGADPADMPPSLKSSSSGAAGTNDRAGATFRPSFPSSPSRTPGSSVPTAQGADDKLQPVPADAFPLRPIPLPEAETAAPGLRDPIPPLIQPAEDRTAVRRDERTLSSGGDANVRTVRATSASQPRNVSDTGWRSVSP